MKGDEPDLDKAMTVVTQLCKQMTLTMIEIGAQNIQLIELLSERVNQIEEAIEDKVSDRRRQRMVDANMAYYKLLNEARSDIDGLRERINKQ